MKRKNKKRKSLENSNKKMRGLKKREWTKLKPRD
jgi:hypothetical protein